MMNGFIFGNIIHFITDSLQNYKQDFKHACIIKKVLYGA